jgi:hypothetical protein
LLQAKPTPSSAPKPSSEPAIPPPPPGFKGRLLRADYDGKLDPKYKPAARRVIAIIVSIPIVVVFGWELWQRCMWKPLKRENDRNEVDVLTPVCADNGKNPIKPKFDDMRPPITGPMARFLDVPPPPPPPPTGPGESADEKPR